MGACSSCDAGTHQPVEALDCLYPVTGRYALKPLLIDLIILLLSLCRYYILVLDFRMPQWILELHVYLNLSGISYLWSYLLQKQEHLIELCSPSFQDQLKYFCLD